MLRRVTAVAALLLVASYAQAQPAKHSFSGLCAYYPGRGGGLTAAHKTLPFGTRVRVTDSKTGRSVIVVINDRGPFNKGRVLDLSTTAAKALGMMERGVVLVGADVLQIFSRKVAMSQQSSPPLSASAAVGDGCQRDGVGTGYGFAFKQQPTELTAKLH